MFGSLEKERRWEKEISKFHENGYNRISFRIDLKTYGASQTVIACVISNLSYISTSITILCLYLYFGDRFHTYRLKLKKVYFVQMGAFQYEMLHLQHMFICKV